MVDENTGQQPSAQEVQQATQQATQQVQQQANSGQITPQTLVDLINGIPDKIVDAMKVAYPAQPAKQPETQQQNAGVQQTTQQQVERGNGLFGGKSFADFWFGK